MISLRLAAERHHDRRLKREVWRTFDPVDHRTRSPAQRGQRVARRRGVFQLRMRCSTPDLEPGREQKRFSTAERRGGLCVVASPDARAGSLRLGQDTCIYSALLEPGQHVVHELAPAHAAWLHVVQGEVTLDDFVLVTGDGAGVVTERAVSLTARADSEILLFDVAKRTVRSP